LHQNVFPEDSIFGIATRVIGHPAVMALITESYVFTEVQHASVELGVGAHASALEIVELRGAALMEVIE